MNKQEIQETIDRYSNRLAEHGYSPKTLGWNKERGALRFEVFTDSWDLNGMHILDFGCGFGDLYGFLEAKDVSFKYTGIDINEDLIKVGRERYPKAEFICGDIFDIAFDRKFDVVLSSGVFNFKLEDNFSFIKRAFEKFDEITKRGIGVNFLSNKVDYELDHTYHADPAEILNLAYSIDRNVVLKNDYMPFEFSVLIRKDAKIHPEKTFYLPL
ncbi:MAG: class I SAM-dependent methyltransferase [Bacteroidota bacterium]